MMNKKHWRGPSKARHQGLGNFSHDPKGPIPLVGETAVHPRLKASALIQARSAVLALALGLALLLGACASKSKQLAPWEEGIPEDKKRVSDSIQGRDLNIGVVALGPKEFMGQDWFDFDPAYRQWVNREPDTVEEGQWTIGLKRHELGDAFRTSFGGALKMLRRAPPRGAVLVLSMIAVVGSVGTIVRSTIGEIRIEKTKPVTRTLSSAPLLSKRIPTKTLDKKRISEKIGRQIIRLGRRKTRHRFQSVAYDLARHKAPRQMGLDAYLTVQVQAVDLKLSSSDDLKPAVQVHVWTNFMGTVGRPWTQTTPPLRLGSGSEVGSGNLNEELDKAVSSLGAKIVDLHFVP